MAYNDLPLSTATIDVETFNYNGNVTHDLVDNYLVTGYTSTIRLADYPYYFCYMIDNNTCYIVKTMSQKWIYDASNSRIKTLNGQNEDIAIARLYTNGSSGPGDYYEEHLNILQGFDPQLLLDYTNMEFENLTDYSKKQGIITYDVMNDIANAINLKLSSSGTMTPKQMASLITAIPSGSGGTVAPSTFTTNGVYPASSDNLDGYSIVTVSVPTTSLSQLSVSANGSYTAPSGYSYDEVTVDVPTVTLSSVTFSSNSVYSAAAGTGYSEVTVDVPVPTMSTLSVNTNGSYAAPSGVAYNQVDVDVSGTPLSSITISINGSYSAAQGTGYDEITVDVQPTLSSTTFSANGSYSVPVGYDGYGDITVDVSANVMSKTFSGNGIYYASADTVDGYDVVTVNVPGAAVLGSKTISINGVYNAIDDSLDGYDTVTISVKSDVGTYDWYSDGVDVSVTVDDVNLSNYSGTNSFYESYSNTPINTLTINAGTSTSLSYFNSNPTKSVHFKKLVLGPGVTRSVDFNTSQFYCMREVDIQNTTSFTGPNCRSAPYIVKVNYQSSVGSISYYQSQFADCRNLESLQLPVSTTIIPSNFCYGCYNLREINLNELENLTEIRYNAFGNCLKIKDVDFSNLSNLTTISNSVFYQTGISEVKSSYLTSVGGFAYCYDLTTVDIPNASYLDAGAFANCINLTSITLSPMLSSIPQYCFQSCTNLRNIDFSNLSSCTEFGYGAFANCQRLSEVILPSAVTTLGPSCFQSCYTLSSIDLNNVTTISSYCFNYCNNLSSIDLDNVITLGSSCFQNCSNLTSVNLSNVATIGDNAFSYDANLTTVILNNSLSTLGVNCFGSCSNLISINLDNITTIGSSCFQNCTNLSSINIENATTIYGYAFNNCRALTSVTLNTALTSIPPCGFRNTGISSIEIPSTVTVIGSSAFYSAPLDTFTFYDTGTSTSAITISANALPNNMTDIYYRGEQGKTVEVLETEYNTKYGNNNYLKPTTHTVHYVPYEDWHTE